MVETCFTLYVCANCKPSCMVPDEMCSISQKMLSPIPVYNSWIKHHKLCFVLNNYRINFNKLWLNVLILKSHWKCNTCYSDLQHVCGPILHTTCVVVTTHVILIYNTCDLGRFYTWHMLYSYNMCYSNLQHVWLGPILHNTRVIVTTCVILWFTTRVILDNSTHDTCCMRNNTVKWGE